MAEGSISPKDLAKAISSALYQRGLAEIRGPPDVARNTLAHMGMLDVDKPGPEDEAENAITLFTNSTEAGDLEKGLLDAQGRTANLATIFQYADARGVIGSYLGRPVIKLIAGFLKGRKDYDTDKFIDDIEAMSTKEIAEKEAQRRAYRTDDLNYAMGELNYQKSLVELEKMLKPTAKRKTKQPKVKLSYKEYCCD